MKALIIGLPYFSNKLAHSLAGFDKDNNYIALNTYEKRIDKFKYVLNLLNTDVVYSIGGALSGCKSIDIALAFQKKIVMHWVGTDVLNAISDYKNNRVDFKYVQNIRHFCEVSWIQDELKQIGIDAEIVQFATFDKKISKANSLPDKFSILSYVGKGREKFYGIEKLIRLASDFFEIEIKIVGISEYHLPVPSNIRFLGWVENMDDEYRNCVLYLRMPEHDGLAFSVLEALANGRYVGYEYAFPNCFQVCTYNDLKSLVLNLFYNFYNSALEPNTSGATYVKSNFNNNTVLDNLICKIM